jgi:ribosome-binding factor A
MITQDLADPRVKEAGIVTVTNVELNSDMSVAWVYVSIAGASERKAKAAIAGLEAAAGHLRGPLGRRMHLARTPSLRFRLDDSGEFRAKLSEIVRDDEARGNSGDDE